VAQGPTERFIYLLHAPSPNRESPSGLALKEDGRFAQEGARCMSQLSKHEGYQPSSARANQLEKMEILMCPHPGPLARRFELGEHKGVAGWQSLSSKQKALI
jgi:hypothetical protein